MPFKQDVSYNVILFYSISGALRAEKLLKKAGITIKLIPVPRQLSSDCGICIRFEPHNEERIKAIIDEAGMDIQGIHQI